MRRIILALLIIFFAPELPAQDSSVEPKKTSILKQWRFIESGDLEILTISPQAVHGRLTGPGLPDEGIEMEKKIVKIVPGPGQKNGVIVVGPDSTLSQPYQAIHWFDLKANEVKLCTNPRVYPTPEAAEKDSKGDPKMSKIYRVSTGSPRN